MASTSRAWRLPRPAWVQDREVAGQRPAEQPLIAKPGGVILAQHEHAVLPQAFDERGRIAPRVHGLGERNREMLQNGGVEDELAQLGRQHAPYLLDEVVGEEPVVDGEVVVDGCTGDSEASSDQR